MKRKEIKAAVLLTLAAIIWGFAFVAQRVGVQYIGSYTFTGVRFALGAFSLMPLIALQNRKEARNQSREKNTDEKKSETRLLYKVGMLAGTILFIAAGLQQLGIKDTTAGKAAFITGFYIIMVPVFGIFLKHKIGKKTWAAAIIAIIGLYLISVEESFTVSLGDLLVFICSFFFSAHILLINQYADKINTLKLSVVQYLTCSALSMITALIFEEIHISHIINAGIPILYGGILSVGVAYTLQIAGQKYAKASHAAIIMSTESVFALIGGIIMLNESMDIRGYLGCLLMLLAVILSQYQKDSKDETEAEENLELISDLNKVSHKT
ncbi:MAG: DMT family transporter [Caldicoprobacterales bacterium]|jgi:drug/metabolite transporter (DMT)-like permease|nr:DMT family transporter [Clostridiales bacterium]